MSNLILLSENKDYQYIGIPIEDKDSYDFEIKNIKQETDKGIFYIEIDYDKWYFWKSVYPNLERIEKMGYKVREYPKHDKDNIYVLRITW